MKTRIPEERLISIATGESEETPDELVILNEDHASRVRLDEFRALFSDLRELPADEIPETEMQSVLPGVREAISRRSWWQRWFAVLPTLTSRSWQAASLAVVVFLFVIFPAAQSPDIHRLQSLDYDQTAYVGLEASTSYYLSEEVLDTSTLLSSLASDDDDLGELDESYTSLYADGSLYAEIASLGDEELALLTTELHQSLGLDERTQ